MVVLALWVLAAVLICSCDRRLKKENEDLYRKLAESPDAVFFINRSFAAD